MQADPIRAPNVQQDDNRHRVVSVGGVVAHLLPECAVLVPLLRALFVADVHLGKAQTFRSMGVPVPERVDERSLERLGALIERHGARRLVVLGDFTHGPLARTGPLARRIAEWRLALAHVEIDVVRGNHDAQTGAMPDAWRIGELEPGTTLGDLRLYHQPPEWIARDGVHAFAGHVHPAVRVAARRDALRLPGFWLRPGCTVLPAFGEFTGGWTITPEHGDRVFVTDGERVHQIPRAARDDTASARTQSARRSVDR